MGLEQYKRKRDFSRTPEPSGDGPAEIAAALGATPLPATLPQLSPGPTPPASLAPATALPAASRAALPAAHSAARVAHSAARAAVAASGRFVVQRHRARNLHYDFRLEIDGVLVSWAVPKGPTLDPAVRRGAYKVEDHPLDYFDFEGTIPARQYGAGDVIVWDWGVFVAEASDDPGRSVAAGELKFELFGEKLRGRYTIVRTRGGPGRPGAARPGAINEATSAGDPAEREEWLLIKKRDAAAEAGWDTEAQPRSVKTGRTNDEVAAGIAPPQPARAGPGPLPDSTGGIDLDGIRGARESAKPDFIEPMKATLTDRPFSDPAWLFELKWDGYRVQAHIRDGRVDFFTRRGQNAVSYFPDLGNSAGWIAAHEAIVDGEVVALDAAGEPDFHLLQAWRANARGRTVDAATSDREPATLSYMVFDLLYLDGHSLVDVPLEERKQLLRAVLRESSTVRYASHVDADGEAFYAVVAERGLEGIVAKLRRSRYEPGRRSPSWLKIKRRQEQEFVVGGWTPRTSSEADLGALLLGVYQDGALRPVGKVGTGFDAAERGRLLALMSPLELPRSPFRPAPREKGVRWVEPNLVARVEFAEWPDGGALRAPSYKGLDIDADPTHVVREMARPADEERRAAQAIQGQPGARAAEPGPPSASPADRPSPDASSSDAKTAEVPTTVPAAELSALDALPGSGGKWTVTGRELKLSNLDKPIWPADSFTKRDLIRYYTAIAPYVLPYLRDRALTVMRHPNGVDKPGFWQKQLPGHTPAWVARWSWESVSADECRDYAVADSPATLAWLANEAAIDLHPSTYRIQAQDRPTWALIDIDPGQKTSWDEVVLMARLYRTALEHLGVRGFPKVSGQRGIQVWIPIRPIYSFDQTRDWVGGISKAVGAMVPELVSWEWEKTRRGGLARLDYTQNAWNKTLVAPYAVRPVAGAAVSAPIAWDELDDPTLRPNGWTIRTIFDRLDRLGDLFEPSLALEQELPAL